MENFNSLDKNYYVQKEYNQFGDVIKVNYFADIDESTGQMFNLTFSETIVINRNNNTGIPTIKTVTRDQVKINEVVFSEVFIERFDKAKGMELNQTGRTNLIYKAQQYTVDKLVETHGENQGVTYGIEFLNSVSDERAKYIIGIIEPLISSIQNCTLTFITEEIKTELQTILNINY